MSYTMFLQRFEGGQAASLDAHAVMAAFAPYITRSEPEHGFLKIRTPDGGDADIYAGRPEDGQLGYVSVSHFSEGDVVDLLVHLARSTDAVILTPDCGTLLVSPEQRQHLPSELRDVTVVVTSGADVQQALSR